MRESSHLEQRVLNLEDDVALVGVVVCISNWMHMFNSHPLWEFHAD